MKKIFALLALVCFASSFAWAQGYVYEDVPGAEKSGKPNKLDLYRLRFGVFAAPTLTWMHPAASTSEDGHYKVSNGGTKVGYAWGLVAEYFFAENYAIVTGFNVEVQGGKLNSTANTAKMDTTLPKTVTKANMSYRLQYIEIPIALKLCSDELPKNGIRVFGQIGLSLALNIGKKASYDVHYHDASGNFRTVSGDNEPLKGELSASPVMFQLNVGAGIECPITEKMHFFTGLYFNNGFLPSAINPKNYDLGYNGSYTSPNVRINSLALRLGLYF